MAYKLNPAEPLPADLKRVAREELDSALAHLREETGAGSQERVHEARKSLKKVRALLRLVRKEIGDDVYRHENDCLRDAARRLSGVRDAEVLVLTSAGLADHATGETRKAVSALTKALDQDRAAAVDDVLGSGDTVSAVISVVAAVRARVDAWPLDRDAPKILAPGIRRAYERGAEARESAFERGDTEDFHDWRKRVKDLWYHGRLVKPADSDLLGPIVDRADELADVLGLDHDMAVLGERVDSLGKRAGDADARRRLHALIERQRLDLQRRAHSLGRALYGDSGKSYARRIVAALGNARAEAATEDAVWLTPADADRARTLLGEAANAKDARRRQATAELREIGIDRQALGRRLGDGSGALTAEGLDKLVRRGVVHVATATDLDRIVRARPAGLTEVGLDLSPNEGSGLCPIASSAVLDRHGWEHGFWVVLDDVPVNEGVVAVGRPPDAEADGDWEGARIDFRTTGAVHATDDAEDCMLRDGYVYLFGSHYGSKEGPIEVERQFVARFREDDAGAEGDAPVLEVAHSDFVLHRLINDALADAGLELFPLSGPAREALVARALGNGVRTGAEWTDRLSADDLPINIEGCANTRRGGVLVGLRFPCTAAGQPLLVELDGIEPLFADPPKPPRVRGVWVLDGIGSAEVPAGVRGLADQPDGRLHVLTGNLDSSGKGSVLIEEHPEGALARSAHFRTKLPGRGRGGKLDAEFVREFPGMHRVEGVAEDPAGRLFYVSDEEERIHLRYAETADSGG